MDQSRSKIKIQVLTAGGAVPLSNVNVRIFSEEAENQGVDRSLLTDESGICISDDLPCPPRNRSEAPKEDNARVFAKYRIQVYQDEFETKEVINAALFDEVTTLYVCHLIPSGTFDKSPHASHENVTISEQNKNL